MVELLIGICLYGLIYFLKKLRILSQLGEAMKNKMLSTISTFTGWFLGSYITVEHWEGYDFSKVCQKC